MYIFSENDYVLKALIYLGNHFKRPKEEIYIELREPTVKEQLLLEALSKATDSEKSLEYMKEFLVKVLQDHNFYKDQKTKMTTEEVVEVVFKKRKVVEEVFSEFRKQVFFQKEQQESEGSQEK